MITTFVLVLILCVGRECALATAGPYRSRETCADAGEVWRLSDERFRKFVCIPGPGSDK